MGIASLCSVFALADERTSVIKPLVSRLYQRYLPNQQAQEPDISPSLDELAKTGLFDAEFYMSQLGDRMSSWGEAAQHYLTRGSGQKLDPHPLFDTAYYVDSNRDLSFDKVNPLLHYFQEGLLEGRNPHPLFDVAFYLERNGDVARSSINPLVHYVTSGGREGRDPCEFFSSVEYLGKVLEIEQSEPGNLLVHFVCKGANANLR